MNALCSTLFGNLLTGESPHGGQITEDAKSFYFDTALSGSANVLDSLLKWAPRDRVLYGSDFPYATLEAEWNDEVLDGYEMDAGMRKAIYRENALKLFPRFAGK